MKTFTDRASLLLAVVLALLLLRQASGASVAQYLPVVSRDSQPPPSTSIVTLVSSDSTYVFAARADAGCTFLTYIDRAHGNRLHLVRDDGNTVFDVPLPPIVVAELAPAAPGFVAPGDKQADGALVIHGATLDLYYTTRGENDPNGVFKLYRLRMATPPCA